MNYPTDWAAVDENGIDITEGATLWLGTYLACAVLAFVPILALALWIVRKLR